MTASEAHIEQLQARLKEIAEREQFLISALNEALTNADRKLLDDMRSVTFEHEARRAVILTELQTLAGRIGAFPIQSDATVETIEYEETDTAILDQSAEPPMAENSRQGGDWRQATKKIAEELDLRLNGTSRSYAAS